MITELKQPSPITPTSTVAEINDAVSKMTKEWFEANPDRVVIFIVTEPMGDNQPPVAGVARGKIGNMLAAPIYLAAADENCGFYPFARGLAQLGIKAVDDLIMEVRAARNVTKETTDI